MHSCSNDKQEGAKYEEWAKDGYITVTEGNDIDLSKVADWFYELYTNYGIKLLRCGYDQKFARDFISRMEEYGWSRSSDELVMVLQNAQTLSGAIKLCEADFKSRVINYNENPVDRWCLKNASIKVEENRLCLIVKSKQSKRIDGAVALAIVYEMYRRYRSEISKYVNS